MTDREIESPVCSRLLQRIELDVCTIVALLSMLGVKLKCQDDKVSVQFTFHLLAHKHINLQLCNSARLPKVVEFGSEGYVVGILPAGLELTTQGQDEAVRAGG